MAGRVPIDVQPLCRMEHCYDVEFINGSVATEFGYIRSQDEGLISCPLPQVGRLWSGLSGRSKCQLKVSLNGGVHWSEPPIAMDVIAAPTLFDATPTRVSADSGTDMFCEKRTVLDIIGSHFNHAIGNDTISPRCWLGEHEGSVISVMHNVTKCSFHSGPRIRQDRMTFDSVALGNGLFGVSLTGPVLKDPMSPKPPVMVFVADPPVINYIRPTVVFQEPGRRLYVYGSHFPPDTGGDCAFFRDGTAGRDRVVVPSVNLNSSLVICPLPEALTGGKYQLMIRFKGGVVAQPHVDQKPVFEVLDPLHVSQFRPSVVGPRRPVQVILDGVSAPLQELETSGSFESEAIYCMWFVYASESQTQGAENSLPVFVSEAGRARVMRCTDPEVTRFCACGQTLKGCQDAEHLVFGSPDESR
ncbi:unnamed protein product [Cladocopium goreaui]|uniref:UPF0420 protein n=1 Tax=Cladocopium goreaui TaxID=2562237 RepID=A0A9P1DM61_9DINO|nr:unnamed protein product [Cladocopium goreaui]